MKPVHLTLLAGIATVLPAVAEPRPIIGRMTCMEASGLVRREGDIVLGTAPNFSERLVRDRGFCKLSEIAELRFVPTRDNPQCPIGYRCREPDYGDWDWE